ncbi:LysR family transcriptional regulator [Methylovorus sp. MM2]|uniref:LysR family transcriptional regulator n=1 Tax=Methylovorus sp. MM2 TaxID=1848038 RepID=UPI0007E0707D|nr:LysR family transcriptional regulator [Methylovorus sp. MM2]OAM51610.1 LysR family transcriptional regulator [Methylovorus sp. MM2]
MDTLRSIESFVKAVEGGSIAAGARQIGITAAAASQNINRLEKTLGTRLLNRSTRSLSLTDSGELYYRQVKSIIHDLEVAKSAVMEIQGEPQGKLRIASSGAFGRHVLAPLIPAFTKAYPRISIELIMADHGIDHIKEDIDISIRFKQQLELGMVARRIITAPMILCASPAYLARAGRPKEPEDLRHHDCLIFRLPQDGKLLRWGFIRQGLRFEPELNASIISNDIDAIAHLAVAGAGIARLGAFLAEPLIQRGELEALFLPKKDHKESVTADIEPLDFYVTFLDQHVMTRKVRTFVDYLADAVPDKWKSPTPI